MMVALWHPHAKGIVLAEMILGGSLLGEVHVHYDGKLWVVPRGHQLTVGRSHSCAIHLPGDDHVSRLAITLQVLDDCVLVRNGSRVKPVVMRPTVGADRVIEPGAAATSLPHPQFTLLLVGRPGSIVTISVDATNLHGPAGSEPLTLAPDTCAEPIVLSGTQRRVLQALCAPLLTESGPRAVPATYAQIGHALGLRPQYIRNVIKALREKLAGYGVLGLVRECEESAHDDFRAELAQWAIRGGWVTQGGPE